MKKLIIAALGVVLGSVGLNAYAATDAKTISPSLTVLTACTVNSTAVSATFGKLGVGVVASSTMVGGSLVVTCPSPFAVGANGGDHKTGADQRNLSTSAGILGNLIAYTLSIDGVAWGDAGLHAIDPGYTDTMTTVAKSADGTASPYTYAITGTTSALGAQPTGTYTDSVIITVAY